MAEAACRKQSNLEVFKTLTEDTGPGLKIQGPESQASRGAGGSGEAKIEEQIELWNASKHEEVVATLAQCREQFKGQHFYFEFECETPFGTLFRYEEHSKPEWQRERCRHDIEAASRVNSEKRQKRKAEINISDSAAPRLRDRTTGKTVVAPKLTFAQFHQLCSGCSECQSESDKVATTAFQKWRADEVERQGQEFYVFGKSAFGLDKPIVPYKKASDSWVATTTWTGTSVTQAEINVTRELASEFRAARKLFIKPEDGVWKPIVHHNVKVDREPEDVEYQLTASEHAVIKEGQGRYQPHQDAKDLDWDGCTIKPDHQGVPITLIVASADHFSEEVFNPRRQTGLYRLN